MDSIEIVPLARTMMPLLGGVFVVNPVYRKDIEIHTVLRRLDNCAAGRPPFALCEIEIIYSEMVPATIEVDVLPNDRFIEYEESDKVWLKPLGMCGHGEMAVAYMMTRPNPLEQFQLHTVGIPYIQ